MITLTMGLGACNWADSSSHETQKSHESPDTDTQVRSDFDCSSIDYSHNLIDESYGYFHNAFLNYFEEFLSGVSEENARDLAVEKMKLFALANRFEYSFLPDDSLDVLTYIDNVDETVENAYTYSILDGGAFTSLLPNYSQSVINHIGSLSAIFATYPDSIDLTETQELIDDIKDWENMVSVSLGLAPWEKQFLYEAGVIARYSLYYWSCYIYHGGPEDWSYFTTGEITNRGSFWNWLKRRALSIAAFDIAGFVFAGGVVGAAMSSTIVGAGFYALDNP